LYISLCIIRGIKSRMGWVEHVAHIGEIRADRIFVRKPDGKRPLGRPRHRWNDISMDLGETGWEGVEWMHLAQDRDQWQAVVNTVMNLWITQKVGNFLTS
jgi:hypothetical protein